MNANPHHRADAWDARKICRQLGRRRVDRQTAAEPSIKRREPSPVHPADVVSDEEVGDRRLLLHEVDRVLYLDADTIAVDSVAELFSLDLDGAAIAAVDNVTEPGRRDFEAELGLPETRSTSCSNAGR